MAGTQDLEPSPAAPQGTHEQEVGSERTHPTTWDAGTPSDVLTA